MNRKSLPIVLLIKILLLISSFSFSNYKINELSVTDGVFKDFREEILFHNLKLLWKSQQFRNSPINNGNRFLKLKLALYTVKENDTISNIAHRSYLDIDTLVSINSLSSSHEIYKGRKIFIPNMKGSLITVNKETNLNILALKLNVSPFILASVNRHKQKIVYKGQKLFIPFRKLSREEKFYFSSSAFLQPVFGRLSSRYGMRNDPFINRKTFHGGVDIAARMGSPVYASQSGRVIFSGSAGGYGKLIIISHKYGYTTFYGHLSHRIVEYGQKVSKGQLIGKVGNTGRCTGSHLHFEIRRNNLKQNPLKFTHTSYKLKN
ncbi:MAG: M23 family metallopeptidase [Spirochaetota bacterium]|nr:M23 family metallopeptidase [Spirochaetota bacterium]